MSRLANQLVASLFFGWMFLGAGTSAHAAQMTYYGRNDSKLDLTQVDAARAAFLATLDSSGVEDFEALTGQTDPTLTFGSTGITAATDFVQVYTYPVLAVSGVNALLDQGPAAVDGPGFNDWIQLSQPVTAFSTYFTQSGDGPFSNTIQLRLENTALGTSKDVLVATVGPGDPFYNVIFFGVTDTDAFDRISLVESADYDGILLDDITVGFVSVPEPSSWILLGLGAALAFSVRRRGHV